MMPTGTIQTSTSSDRTVARDRSQRSRIKTALTSNTAARTTAFVLLLLLWTIGSLLIERIPTPTAVAGALLEEARAGEITSNFLLSTGRYFIGVGIACLIGATLGILAGLSKLWRAFFGDILMVGLTMPAIIWAFLAVMWFGLGGIAQVWATVLAATPFVAVNVMQGARSLPRDLRDMSDAYDVSLFRQVKSLVIPGLMGYLAAGVRFAMIIGWNTVLLSEWFGGTDGVGFRARYWYDANRYRGFAAWVLLFIVFVVILDRGALTPLLKRANRWNAQAVESSADAATRTD